MDHAVFNGNAPKKPVNVRIDSDLPIQVRSSRIDLSQALEAQLTERIAERRRSAWKKENREAIAEYNGHITQHGLFGDKARVF